VNQILFSVSGQTLGQNLLENRIDVFRAGDGVLVSPLRGDDAEEKPSGQRDLQQNLQQGRDRQKSNMVIAAIDEAWQRRIGSIPLPGR
jgi:hypothetical protein